MTKDSSPFHQTDFHPIGDIYTVEGVLFGLRQSNGNILVNFDQNTSYSRLLQIARITSCEIVQVRGTWTFLPHRNVTVKDEDIGQGNSSNDVHGA